MSLEHPLYEDERLLRTWNKLYPPTDNDHKEEEVLVVVEEDEDTPMGQAPSPVNEPGPKPPSRCSMALHHMTDDHNI